MALLTIDLNVSLADAVERAITQLPGVIHEGLGAIVQALKPPRVKGGRIFFRLLPTFQGGDPMATYKVPDDHVDESYALEPCSAKDQEGNDIPLGVTMVESSDANVVSVDVATGTVHFGAPGVAMVTATTKRADSGEIVKVDVANFIIGLGATGAVAGGGLSFPGLTAEPEA